MPVNSRAKGARWERDLSKLLGVMFPSLAERLRRGQQFAGGPDSPDVVGLPGFHIEAKHVNRLNLREAMEQAVRDSGGRSIPVVIHKSDRACALVTLRLSDVRDAAKAVAEIEKGDAA
jgi:hypothetical protein